MQRSSSSGESDVLYKQFSLAGDEIQNAKEGRDGAGRLERDLIMKGL